MVLQSLLVIHPEDSRAFSLGKGTFLYLHSHPKHESLCATVDVLRRFGMMDCKSMATSMLSHLKKLHETTSGEKPIDPMMYRQRIGSLLYLVHMRPDICYAMSALSQFMYELRHMHWVAAKHVLRYLCGTVGYGLRYTSIGGVRLFAYTDLD